MNRVYSIFMIVVVGTAMATGIRNVHLRGPDEPRVAEIARETLVDGHWIIVDIGVGAMVVGALTCFARAEIFPSEARKIRAFLYPFALFTAAAFLTKGAAGVVTIPLIIGAFCLLERRWAPIREILSPAPLLIFAVPVGAWLFLNYREGGIPYLHEHFVNNYLGRFLQVQYHLPDTRFYHTDVGVPWPRYFYLQRLPDILGVWLFILPFAAWTGLRSLWRREERPERPVFRFLLLWSFLPMLAFSFAAQKEVTYIIPSYAGMAILIGDWLDRTVAGRAAEPGRGGWWPGIVFPLALLTFFSSGLNRAAFIAISAATIAALLALLILFLRRGRRGESLYVALAILLSVTMISHSPVIYPLIHRQRIQSCFELAPDIWKTVGRAALHLYRPHDDIRGTIPFHGKRTTPEIDRLEDLIKTLSGPAKVYVIMSPWIYEASLRDPILKNLIQSMQVQMVTGPGTPAALVLISNPP
ncbi:MAG: hypothetical protein V1789_01910 [PVC group bacterium]